jgi:hypothetical protein
MKRVVAVIAVVCGVAISGASAGYTIDGNLNDWGVTLFTHWAPGGTADYTQTAGVNYYNAESYEEYYDFKAMYFDDDAKNFYFAVVGTYPVSNQMGDLGLDLNNNWTISEHGIVTGLEYGIRIGTNPQGQVVLNPVWSNTIHYRWTDGWQGSPYQIVDSTGTVVGSATVAAKYHPELTLSPWVLEVAVSRSLFPDGGGDSNDVIGIHQTLFCGNDSINLLGTIDSDPFNPPPPTPTVPVPAALLLAGLGAGIIGGLRRRKLM